MSAKDDVKTDLGSAYERLTRPDIEMVVRMVAQAPAGHGGSSVAAALRPVFPEAADRLQSAPAAEQTDYLRVLKGASVAALQWWTDSQDPKPELTRIIDFVDDVEGDA